uniref:Uncharacterized protein n=1 Tax=Arundo donax TaxID=35708 RepID=A0A0A8YPA2_ARUDO
MASQSSHGSQSSFRTTLSKLGARSSTALMNVICCFSGLSQPIGAPSTASSWSRQTPAPRKG